MGICFGALIAALALAVVPAHAKAAPPVLEFVVPGNDFPVDFEADGGDVTAELAGVATEMRCAGSEGEGEIVGPRSTLSNYVFTGCEAEGGPADGEECHSEGADPGEISTGTIEADLVFIDQAKRQVGMLLNPAGGIYMSFDCGGTESMKARGPFLSPVGPINEESTSFTATLTRLGATQTPNEYENAIGEKRNAIPEGQRESDPWGTSGVELDFTIHTSASLQVKAITAAEIETKQREEEAAAAKKRQDEEAAAAAAAKKRQDEEAAAAAAVVVRQEEEAKLKRLRRALLSGTLKQCRQAQAQSKPKRVRCEKRAKKKYGSAKSR
jgi:hypothetical protein